MRVDLVELLRTNAVVHPTSISAVNLSGGTLRVTVTGQQWWKQRDQQAGQGQIDLIFEGLSEGRLDVCESNLDVSGYMEDEALESFDVRPLKSFAWAPPDLHSIYCSGSLRDPVAIFQVLQDYLAFGDSYRQPSDFLNCCSTLSQFRRLCSSGSFLLARCPEYVSELVCAELGRQGVPFNIISREAPPDSRLRVQLGGSDFVCDTARAVFD